MSSYKTVTESIAVDLKSLETILKVMSSCPKECLYAVINECDKRIQVFSTSNFISHISRLAQELGHLNNKPLLEDLQNIKVVILETEFRDKKHRYSLYRREIQKYKDGGWTFYSDRNVALYRLNQGYKYKGHKLYYVVELVARNGDRTVVGAFTKAKEAKRFISEHYSNDIITEIVIDPSSCNYNE